MGERLDEPGRSEKLAAAMDDYESTRDDERAFLNAQAAMFGVLVAIVAAVAAIYRDVNPQLLAVALVAPVAVILYLQIIGTQAVIRSFYLRDLEKRIHELMPRADVNESSGRGSSDDLAVARALDETGNAAVDEPIATYASVMVGIVSLRRGDPTYRALVAAIIGIVLAIFGGLAVYVALQVPGWVRVAMIVVYGGAAVFLFAAQRRMSLHGKDLYDAARRAVVAERAASPGAASGDAHDPTSTAKPNKDKKPRTLVSYLVLPRPNDLIKWAIVPLTWLLVAVGLGQFSLSEFGMVLFATVLLEWGIYSSRYQLNDIRGLPSDIGHPEATRRGRLPVPSADPATWVGPIQVSLAVAIARVVLVFLIVACLDLELLPLAAAALFAVFAVAGAYELLRDRAISAEPHCISLLPTIWDRATWIAVTLGYGVRAALALALFANLGGAVTWQVALLTVMFLAALGAIFVYQTWALEGTGLLALRRSGDSSEVVASSTAMSKTHVLRLTAYAMPPLKARGSIQVDQAIPDISSETPEAAGGEAPASTTRYRSLRIIHIMVERVTFASPWSIALVVTLGFGGALGVAFVDPGRPLRYLVAAGFAAAFGLLVALMRTGPLLLVICTIGVIALEAALVLGGITWVAGVPVVVAVAIYLAFSVQSYESLSTPVGDLVGLLVDGAKGLVLSALVGRAVRDRVWPEHHRARA